MAKRSFLNQKGCLEMKRPIINKKLRIRISFIATKTVISKFIDMICKKYSCNRFENHLE